MDRTGYSAEIPVLAVAHDYSLNFKTLQEPRYGGRSFRVREAETWAGTPVLEYEALALEDALALLQCLYDIIDEAETTGVGRWWTMTNFLCPTKLHLCPQTALFAHFFTLCPDPPILCPAFYVRKASGSSVDLGQLKRTGSDGRR